MKINGLALRSIRERAGKSGALLARQAGISQAHLSNLERGERQASPKVAKDLADALLVHMGAFIDFEDEVVA